LVKFFELGNGVAMKAAAGKFPGAFADGATLLLIIKQFHASRKQGWDIPVVDDCGMDEVP